MEEAVPSRSVSSSPSITTAPRSPEDEPPGSDDGWPLGSAAFRCDTLGVNPGERYDVIVDCDDPGAWASHCHILTYAESSAGMFGMVNALIVQA